MDKQIIKTIIIEKQNAITTYPVVKRDIEFDSKANYVLVGLRRSGKSYLLYYDIQSQINKCEKSKEDILYINFEDERLFFEGATELGEILDAYYELYPQRIPLIYLDEIQIVSGWEKFARRLADSKYRVMITGSNAKMLSREIASSLGGRFVSKEISPFSFKEYLRYKGIELRNNWLYDSSICAIVSNGFDEYFYNGGIAEAFPLSDKREYLNSLYQKILVGDIVERNGIRNPRVFRLLVKKLADSVMQPSSISRLHHIVCSSGDKISLSVLKDYLDYIEEAYLFFSIPNLASSVTEQTTIQKRYMVDNGLLNLFLLNGQTKLLENIVATELNRRYRNTQEETLLYYYNKNIEVDFCIPSEKCAIQVSYSLADSNTYEREVGALVAFLKKNPDYSATIITRDQQSRIEKNGYAIDVVPVWKWLCMNDNSLK